MIRLYSGSAVMVFCLVIATPFCGWLFACGCSWPGSGLDSACNINIADNMPHCPWCVSLTTGISVLVLATLGGTWLAALPYGSDSTRNMAAAIAVRTLSGGVAFLILAALGAALAAAWQAYPLGIGRLVNGT